MPTRPPSVAIEHYRTHPGCGVQLHCLGCQLTRDYDLESVIARLDARGLDGARVGIKAVADHVTEPCPRCGGTAFESRPAWRRAEDVDRSGPYAGF